MEFKVVVESLLTASQFEVSVFEADRILNLKMSIEKILGIPVSQQHLLHLGSELNDHAELKEGMRLKLIPSMRVGPIQSARRVLPSLTDYDSWFDNEVLHNSKRDEPLMLKTKYLVYKGCKKNIHRWKVNGEKSKSVAPTSSTKQKYDKPTAHMYTTNINGHRSGRFEEDERYRRVTDQTIQENIRTAERMNELRLKIELNNKRKKLKSVNTPATRKVGENAIGPQKDEKLQKPSKELSDDRASQKLQKEEQLLSTESKAKLKSSLLRNRSFKAIINPSNFVVSSSTPSEKTVASRKEKVKESISMQDFGAYGLLFKEPFAKASATSAEAFQSEEANMNFNSSMPRTALRDCREIESSNLAKPSRVEINEYFILPKLLVRNDSSIISEATSPGFEDFKNKSSDTACANNQHSTESLIEYCDHLSSSSTSSLVSYQPKNRCYHSEYDLNQLTTRFKTKLSLSNQDIKTSEGNSSTGDIFLSEENYEKWASVDCAAGQSPIDEDEPIETAIDEKYLNSELVDYFSSNSNNLQSRKYSSQRMPPLKVKTEKLKCFGSNPTLTSVSNLAATTTTSTNFLDVQISLLESIPTKYRRGYINLNDACLSNTDLSLTQKIPRPLSERKPMIAEKKNFDYGSGIFHCPPHSRNIDICDINPADLSRNDIVGKTSSGRQSRFEHCDNYYSNLNQYASITHKRDLAETFAPPLKASGSSSFDFQSEENLFNMNFDSFYEDFSNADLSWSSTESSTTSSFESSSESSLYEKKYKVFPKIELNPDEPKTLLMPSIQAGKEDSGKLRCFQCNKKLGIIMIMKCHCEKVFCSQHRYKEAHECTYDYKTEGKKKLELENPVCVTQKLPKI